MRSSERVAKDHLAELEAKIETGLQSAYAALVEIRDQKLYQATHDTFEAYCLERWGISRSRAYQLIDAAEIHAQVTLDMSTIVDKIPEGQLRPLKALPEPERKEAFEAAKEATGGKPTAKAVQAEVDRRLGKPEKAPAAPKPEPPKTSVVNGRPAADPPDVAKLRAAGKIPAGVTVEITEPEEDEHPAQASIDDAEERKAIVEEMSDEDWLRQFKVREKLEGSRLRCFDQDAILYRHTNEARLKLVRAIAGPIKQMRRLGEFAFRLRTALKIEAPDKWRVCATPENGGCGGSGVTKFGECQGCHGRGYRI